MIDMGMLKVGGIGLATSVLALPFVADISANAPSLPSAENLATRGTPYVLAVVIIALTWALYRIFGLFLEKVQEREDDLKTVLKETSTAVNRMVDHCQGKVSPK